jgi:F-type H+-transporting ATPase subunit b
MLARLPSSRLFLAGLMLIPFAGVSRAEETKGMPQLDPHSYASQIFWLAIFFFSVFLFLRFVGLPRVTAIIEERAKTIGGDLASADGLRAQAAEAEAAYEATMAEAHARARQLLAETHDKNVTRLTEQTKAAALTFDRRIGEAVERIEAARTEALRGIQDVARGLAADITVKLAGHAPSAASVTKAVDAAAGQEAA